LCNRCRAAIRRTAARPPLGLLHRCAQLVHHESASVSTRNSPSIPMLRMGPLAGHPRRYIRSIIALPNPEQLTCVEPGIRRAKS
jgi:hypothetical protein